MSKFLRRDALKLLSSILAVCPLDHLVHMIQQSKILPVVFSILMKSDEQKPVKNSNVNIKAPSKSEIDNYYEHILSSIWSMIKQLHNCSEIKVKISQERLIFKLLENNLEKTKRVH
jgi:hypothetical protein